MRLSASTELITATKLVQQIDFKCVIDLYHYLKYNALCGLKTRLHATLHYQVSEIREEKVRHMAKLKIYC